MHLFDDKGIDASAYEDVVDFRDPITKYTNIEGYMFNIKFLKKAFNPIFELHEAWVSDADAVTTRWTMTMEFTATKGLPIVGKVFRPTITFTGTSTYVYNPSSGKISMHIDEWDSIKNQEFFSVEGFADFFKQLLQPFSAPDLETPGFTLLKRMSDFQVRRYKPFIVAESLMDGATSSSSSGGGTDGDFSPAGMGTQAFRNLAGYIFGANTAQQKMAMTTPVYSDSSGKMQFVIGPSAAADESALPAPVSRDVSTRTVPGGLFAVRVFNGTANENSAAREREQLLASLAREGLQVESGAPWQLARYNGPGTPGFVRRNEVLIPLDEAAFMEAWPGPAPKRKCHVPR